MSKHGLKLVICGQDELEKYRINRLTHLISISNPGADDGKPAWYHGEMLTLRFGDVISEADARQCRTKAPSSADVLAALSFVRKAVISNTVSLLVHCDYGASRSPGLGYVLLADQLGEGHEAQALATILKLRPQAVPNKLLVKLGDEILRRQGALLAPLRELYRKIDRELSFPPLEE